MNSDRNTRIIQYIARDISIQPWQVQAVIELFAENATVPFIARYRKERTGSLDDTQLRLLEERYLYYTALEDRRETVLKSISEQGKLSADLEREIMVADNRQQLEDLYLPYRPKRHNAAMAAKEAGLEPLLEAVIAEQGAAEDLAQAYVQAESPYDSVDAVLKGIRAILAERITDNSVLVPAMREALWREGMLVSKLVDESVEGAATFKDYFDYSEAIDRIPSHRALALLRGFRLGVLRIGLENTPELTERYRLQLERALLPMLATRAKDDWLSLAADWTWRIKLLPSLETELLGRLKEIADSKAIDVFGTNLKALLMAAPAGSRVVMGLDPGYRNGCKIAVVNAQGALLKTFVVFPQRDEKAAMEMIRVACAEHKVEFLAIGNGTASRETDVLVGKLLRQHPELNAHKVVVSEAGASVYSASEAAAAEFPDVDVSFRGAISIARRLQDPLAELVKIDPQAIGVGQYQHDVNQTQLAERLDHVVEDCVNAVGVDVNTASVEILRRISGLGLTKAKNIVELRTSLGGFKNRSELTKVKMMGPKTYTQCIGFLRINGGDNPLDCTSVHPESYPIVERMLATLGRPLEEVMGQGALLRTLKLSNFVTETTGLPTLEDIVRELEKPARDPREQFTYANFSEEVQTMADLRVGMQLEGVVTNVAAFGAFVDIGVHQDGLVHISQLSDRFVSDPHDIVKVGDIVKVSVLEVDEARHRISLTMKKTGANAQARGARRADAERMPRTRRDNPAQSAMAAAFGKLNLKR